MRGLLAQRGFGTLLLLVGLVALPLAAAQAQGDEAFIQYRQKLMQSIGGHMGAIGAIMKNKLQYESLHVVNHAKAMNLSSGLIAEAFQKQVIEGKTDVKPEIWSDWSEFESAAKKLGEEAAKLADVAASGDMAAVGAQVKSVGDACGGCHKPFRKPKEESYKRK